jgi:hypothetical protein
MEEIGQARPALVARARLPVVLWAGLAFAGALLLGTLAWPFAIDDAWISVRYARHLAEGLGYVWNASGPATDGVTPLPWAVVLAPLAHAAPVVVLWRAKALGLTLWCGTAAVWGARIGELSRPTWVKIVALLVMAESLPLEAHAVSGMETSVAIALVTLASVVPERSRRGACLAGLAAAFRPELVVWAVVLSVGLAVQGAESERRRRAWVAGALAALPFVVCACVRRASFGDWAPLAVRAKPSDLSHGLAYTGACFFFSLAPLLLVAPIALGRASGAVRALALAAAAHFVVVALVGGDWMPYARLVAPVVPSMLYAFVLLAPEERAWCHALRGAAAVALGAWFLSRNLPLLRQAGHDREAMIENAPAMLGTAKVVASLDIGWISAVREGEIVDLAGVTDPEVAALPGGHTSKRIDAGLLRARGVDLVVFYTSSLPLSLDEVSASSFSRVVEARLARSEEFAERFLPVALLPLGREAGYVLYGRR